ncbi:molybdopterin biosynthesis protein [Xanthomonas citri pv. aurantifolii str. ICPB 11122]|nr:molybdopterin biosynthesis protein [Xanthomonas citri pv. aurantifolii str. ICPB 11122]
MERPCAVSALLPADVEIKPAHGLRAKVDILILDVDDGPHRCQSRAGDSCGVVGSRLGANNVGVAASLGAQQIVEDERVTLSKQSDDARLLDPPIIGTKAEAAQTLTARRP